MKRLLVLAAIAVVCLVAVSVATAAVSSPCSGYTKPVVKEVCKKECPAPTTVVQSYRRDVLGQKVPVETHKEGDALTDKATKYEEQLLTGVQQ